MTNATTLAEIEVFNIAVDIIQQQVAEVGDEAKAPEYWREYLSEHPQHAEIYANVAQELSYYEAMAPTFISTGATSIAFAGEEGEPDITIDLTTFKKSIAND